MSVFPCCISFGIVIAVALSIQLRVVYRHFICFISLFQVPVACWNPPLRGLPYRLLHRSPLFFRKIVERNAKRWISTILRKNRWPWTVYPYRSLCTRHKWTGEGDRRIGELWRKKRSRSTFDKEGFGRALFCRSQPGLLSCEQLLDLSVARRNMLKWRFRF